MTLLPVYSTVPENEIYLQDPQWEELILQTITFFERIGYNPPWIGYFVQLNEQIVGSCAFKGQPQEGKVEIAYGVFPAYQNQGIATQICKKLIDLAFETDPTVLVTARTLPEMNYSARLLEKNGFICQGIVIDPEDGEVWEWFYPKN
jgi:RimJ/RimL family protein N-acetyltransferase